MWGCHKILTACTPPSNINCRGWGVLAQNFYRPDALPEQYQSVFVYYNNSQTSVKETSTICSLLAIFIVHFFLTVKAFCNFLKAEQAHWTYQLRISTLYRVIVNSVILLVNMLIVINLCDIWQVLSGCGVYDGSEIHEASAYVWILSIVVKYKFTSLLSKG